MTWIIWYPAHILETSIYPPVMTNIAIEHGHRNSGFSDEKLWFSIAMLVYQRVIHVQWFLISLGHVENSKAMDANQQIDSPMLNILIK
jgi:hypothetical protein